MAKTKDKSLSEGVALRRRAEDRLRAKPAELPQSRTADEMQRLVHELEVHQIELEMQNAALSQSRDEVESALDKYTDLYDFAPVSYFSLDSKGRILSANLTAASLVGKERSRLTGLNFGLFVAVEDRVDFTGFFEKLFASCSKECCELSLLIEGSSRLYVRIEAIADIYNSECRLAVIDIGARRLAEDALRESEERFRAIASASADWIWEIDIDFRYTFASGKIMHALGYEPEEILGRTPFDLMPPGEAARIRGEFQAIVNRRDSFRDLPNINLHKNGEIRHILTTGLPIIDRQGELCGYRGVDIDITERKLSEIALQESEHRIQQALHVSRSFTFDWQPATDRVVRSTSCSMILKLTGDEVVNDTGDNYFQRIHPDDRPRFVQLLGGMTPASDSYTTQYHFVCHDGDEITLEETGQAFFDSHGRMVRLVGVTTDITARKDVELALERVHEELEQRVRERTADLETALETIQAEDAERLKIMDELRKKEQMLLQQNRLAAMGEMINNIAHQWRQPLNTLGLLVQKLPMKYDSAEFNREFLENNTAKAMKLIQHMSQTINDFRGFFRIDKEMVTFGLSTLIRQAVAFIAQTFQDLSIKIDLQADESLMIRGYPNEYAQALLNILMNSRDALVENNVENARIVLRVFKDVGLSVVTVTDNAGGIPEEIIGRVFDPYFSTKGPDKGTGLGLFMSKTIIEKNMSGRLRVYNAGDGAEFRIEVECEGK
jgi:PAS domain S-box-containing protein